MTQQRSFDHRYFGLLLKKLLAVLGDGISWIKLGQLSNVLKYTSRL